MIDVVLGLLLVTCIGQALAIRNLLKAVEAHNKAFESVHESIRILRDAVFPEP